MYESFSYAACYIHWSRFNFLQVHSMMNNKDFHVNFSLKNIPVMSKFVARNAKMKRLKNELISISLNERYRKVFVLHELGEVGKTQLSVGFARKYHAKYSAILWIDGSIKEKLRRSIADFAVRLPPDQFFERVKNYSQKKSFNVDEMMNEIFKWLY